jgi:anhydro-N-acetylmuramic acid kinase
LKKLLPGQLYTADELGWPGDALEAQAFAFLAVRSLAGLPLTFPSTTGVAEPLTGGVFAEPEELLTEEVEDWISER